MSKKKFSDVPVEDDTKILSSSEFTVSGIDCRFESWLWDGIEGISFIFLNGDIPKLSEEELIQLIISEQFHLKKLVTTFKKGEKYTFVNFFDENNCNKDYYDFYDYNFEPPIYSEKEKAERKKKFLEYVRNHNESQSKL